MTRAGNNQRGSILLLVLVIVALLSAMIVELAFSTRVDLRLTETFRDSTQAYYLARGGIEVGKAFIASDQLVNVDAFPVEDHFISLSTKDLGGRLDLNRLVTSSGVNPDSIFIDRFTRLFTSLGLNNAEIDERIDALIDWIDTDNHPRSSGAENEHYGNLNPPRSTKNAPLDRVDEISQIRGFSPEFIDSLRPHVTVYAEAKVNINSATAEVLMALSDDIDAAAAQNLIEYRQTTPLKKSADLQDVTGLSTAARSALSIYGQYESRFFELTTRAEVNDGRRTIVAVIQKGSANPLYLRIQ